MTAGLLLNINKSAVLLFEWQRVFDLGPALGSGGGTAVAFREIRAGATVAEAAFFHISKKSRRHSVPAATASLPLAAVPSQGSLWIGSGRCSAALRCQPPVENLASIDIGSPSHQKAIWPFVGKADCDQPNIDRELT